MFSIGQTFKKDRYTFNIYNHSLSIDDLQSAICEMILDKKTLNYLFTGSIDSKLDNRTILMLRRFIPDEFFFREKTVLEKWNSEQSIIDKGIEENNGYYSFFAEALMAYLNFKYLDNKLAFGIMSLNETLTDQHSGVDSCMFSRDYIVLGEAKFYKNFQQGKIQIINDFNSNSLINKMHSLYRSTVQSNIIIKDINERTIKITMEEFMNHKKILSGFILHNKCRRYSYFDIIDIKDISQIQNCDIIFYHLPINDKKQLIKMIIKRALELIVYESR